MDQMPENMEMLQNIEWAIVHYYRDHRDLTDYQVDSAMEALGRTYARERTGGAPTLPKNEMAREVYAAMKSVCDMLLGRQTVVDTNDQPISLESASVDDILAALKRLRKSLETWNKRGGTRGYLDYINQFLV